MRGTVLVEGVPARELLARASSWGVQSDHALKELQQLDARGNASLVIHGAFEVPSTAGSAVEVRHTLTLELLDGAYYYAITDLQLAPDASSVGVPLEDARAGGTERAVLLARICKGSEQLVADLARAMAGR